jgi:cytochrome oxidase Cu insertion factor (SCO1/SenC/PrrC family)
MIMKKFSRLALFLLFGLGLVSCSQSSTNTPRTNNDVSTADVHGTTAAPEQPVAMEPTEYIPDFTFYILKNGIKFQKSDLKWTGNQVFVLFDPNCNHCQIEAKTISERIGTLKDVQLYFVSMNDPGLMSTFLPTYGKSLVDHPQVEVLYDRNQEFINKFHIPNQFPATYVYGKDGQLKVYWEGEQPADRLVELILQ